MEPVLNSSLKIFITLFCYSLFCISSTEAHKSAPGTGTAEYWENHAEAWVHENGNPIDQINIGGVIYTRDDAIILLHEHDSDDMTYVLFNQLVAARLNMLIGNEYYCIQDIFWESFDWLTEIRHPLGAVVDVHSGVWEETYFPSEYNGVLSPHDMFLVLYEYNNGQLCAPPMPNVDTPPENSSTLVNADVGSFLLKQNNPNPFNPVTSIQFSIPRSSHVLLTVHNISGINVETIADESYEAGFHSLDWNASHLPSGVYLYRMRAGKYSAAKKMLLMK